MAADQLHQTTLPAPWMMCGTDICIRADRSEWRCACGEHGQGEPMTCGRRGCPIENGKVTGNE